MENQYQLYNQLVGKKVFFSKQQHFSCLTGSGYYIRYSQSDLSQQASMDYVMALLFSTKSIPRRRRKQFADCLEILSEFC